MGLFGTRDITTKHNKLYKYGERKHISLLIPNESSNFMTQFFNNRGFLKREMAKLQQK
jgi:hypothetical protein